ncbi:flagellinolysin [Butyrivibrio sp. JL13D10]
MRIQHNLQSMNSNRQLGITTREVTKTSEKLASGYKINRAADDAAGLTISEKMRRQIRGLGRAAKNGHDGISLVQIADGALNEVHDMLHRGNELAVQAANGTNSESDRRAINEEIVAIKKELDAINSRTKFNEMNVFVKGGVIPPRPAEYSKIPSEIINPLQEVGEKIAEEYYPNAIEQIMNSIASIGDKIRELAEAGTSDYDTELTVDYIDGKGNILGQMGAGFQMPGQKFRPQSLMFDVDSDDFPSMNLSPKELGNLESTVAHETMHAIMDVAFPTRMYPDGGPEDFPLWFIEGSAQLTGGGFQGGWNDYLTSVASVLSSENDTRLDSYIADYMSKGGDYTVDTRPYGHGFLATAYAAYLTADGTDVSIGNLRKGASDLFQNFLDADSGGRNDSFSDVIQTSTGWTSDQLKDMINRGSTIAPRAGKYSPVEFVRRLAYNSLGGAGSIIADSLKTGGTDILGDTAKKDDQPFKITGMKIKYMPPPKQEVTEEDKVRGHYYTVDLHVGTDADMTNKINVLKYDIGTKALRLEDTNVLTAELATKAIDSFSDAILSVSSIRSYYGSVQNRLEHTLLNLDNVVENTTASESRMRDTDIAEEMVKKSMQNILSQAGQSILAQANQTPQGVMSLLQQ